MTVAEIIVNCRKRGYSAIRDDLPTVNVTTLDFTGNKLTALTDNMFASFSDLPKPAWIKPERELHSARVHRTGATYGVGLERHISTEYKCINTSLCRDMPKLQNLLCLRVWNYHLWVRMFSRIVVSTTACS